jgi:hypothetical protein
MNGNSAEMPKAVKIWAVVGFVFAALYLAIAIFAFTSHPENYEVIGALGLTICVLQGMGGVLALTRNYSAARALMIIGGILGFPLGMVMVAGGNSIKKATTPGPPTGTGSR